MGIIVVTGEPADRVARLADHVRGRGWDTAAPDPFAPAPDAAVLFAVGTGGPTGALAEVLAQTRYLGGPVVVVAADEAGPWLDAGAVAVYGRDVTDAHIIATIEANRDARPVPAELAADLFDAIVSAVTVPFQESCFAGAYPQASYTRLRTRTLGDVSGVLRVTSPVVGCVVVNCPTHTATAVAGRMMIEAGTVPDAAMVRDCIGELANVVAGQLKTLLYGTRYHFQLTTPVVVGAGHDIGPGAESLIVAFDSDLGPLAVQLVLTARDENQATV